MTHDPVYEGTEVGARGGSLLVAGRPLRFSRPLRPSEPQEPMLAQPPASGDPHRIQIPVDFNLHQPALANRRDQRAPTRPNEQPLRSRVRPPTVFGGLGRPGSTPTRGELSTGITQAALMCTQSAHRVVQNRAQPVHLNKKY